jgi:hypothetical protein
VFACTANTVTEKYDLSPQYLLERAEASLWNHHEPGLISCVVLLIVVIRNYKDLAEL